MATLIPALGTCLSRMTSGEKRLAERLQHKLDDDYLLWYDVPVGPKQSHPDFVVMHPRRGVLILETKDWRLETVQQATRQAWTILATHPHIIKAVQGNSGDRGIASRQQVAELGQGEAVLRVGVALLGQHHQAAPGGVDAEDHLGPAGPPPVGRFLTPAALHHPPPTASELPCHRITRSSSSDPARQG